MEVNTQPASVLEALASPTPPVAPTQRFYNFSPRADISALEAAHCGFLMNTAKSVVSLEEHPSWPICGRHFEMIQVPVSVEPTGHEQAQAAAVAGAVQSGHASKRKGRRMRWLFGKN